MATLLPSKEKLEKFGLDHFNYINLVFGDQNIRRHIMEATAKDRGVRKYKGRQYVGIGKKRKRAKMATHKRKKRLRKRVIPLLAMFLMLVLMPVNVAAHTADDPFKTDLIAGGGNDASAVVVGDISVSVSGPLTN